VLATLLYAIITAYKGWFSNKAFTKFDNNVRHITATVSHIQLSFGIWLYFVSPISNYFMQNPQQGLKLREIRFFGMEHGFMMIIAITVITIGSARAKRQSIDKNKFKTIAIWFTIGLLIILSSIPWQFSPLISRPYFRPF